MSIGGQLFHDFQILNEYSFLDFEQLGLCGQLLKSFDRIPIEELTYNSQGQTSPTLPTVLTISHLLNSRA